METNTDFYFIPKIIINDVLNSGTTITGPALLTKRYFFILADKVDGGEERSLPAYDKEYVKKAVANPEEFELAIFEAEMLSKTATEMVIHTSDFEKFSVQVGFGFIGGLNFKRKAMKLQSAAINKKQTRLEIKEFYSHLIKK